MKNRIIYFLKNFFKKRQVSDTNLLALGAILSKQINLLNYKNINDYEFKIFSQWGDDGLIQYILQNIYVENKTFIEFGVENFLESNTRFLMMNNNWEGYVLDGSLDSIQTLKNQNWFWKFALNAKSAFITKNNINTLLNESGFNNIGLLHIDLDGNDYHIFDTIDLTSLNPSIIIIEYNSIFGKSRSITVPYDENFYRTNKHFSNLYWGASLSSLNVLAEKRGYSLICCNSAGNNAYFVRKDLLNDKICQTTIDLAYKESNFRESRDINGNLNYLEKNERYDCIKGLIVLNTISNELEIL